MKLHSSGCAFFSLFVLRCNKISSPTSMRPQKVFSRGVWARSGGRFDWRNKATLLSGVIILLYLGCKVLACLWFLLSCGYFGSQGASIPLWYLGESLVVEEAELPVV